jgi:hypothetical protein
MKYEKLKSFLKASKLKVDYEGCNRVYIKATRKLKDIETLYMWLVNDNVINPLEIQLRYNYIDVWNGEITTIEYLPKVKKFVFGLY